MAGRDPATDQLVNFRKSLKESPGTITTKAGAPIGVKTGLQTVGPRGPALLQDVNFLDEISSFDRERIPERVVHAKGAGAFGYFEVTHDITKYSAAKLFEKVGKRTPIAVRFSTVGGESGSADSVRDPRGFAIKFYTDDGNWDLVGNNTPIFFIRDPTLFPSFIHTQKRNPATHLKDPDMFWDFLTLRPEGIHQLMFHFADRGIPDGYRHMNGYGSHTFKFVNAQGEFYWVKFHSKTNQGIKNLPADKANELAATDPDYSIRDLYNAIARGDNPTWNFHVQIMTAAQAESCNFNPFDLTKIWPQAEYPLIPVGKLVLNRNPKNYFAEVEQIAFNPANLVPGIEPSPDKVLQGRLFAYGDTHRHRLGANFLQIPVNCPYQVRVANYMRDGPQNITNNQEGCPNYFPNSFSGPQECPRAQRLQPSYNINAAIDRYDSGQTEDNFSQATLFYTKVLDAEAKKRLVANAVAHLKDAAGFLQERAIKMFGNVHPDLGQQIAAALAPYKKYHSNL
ncbi:catalase-like [Plutella xylostella]|uniref:catalase-like n=1 Tax=Plutella xylostella TaxID=51655 RepID=UPI002032BC80|nr:catalase-like [Plutella xylostella]